MGAAGPTRGAYVLDSTVVLDHSQTIDGHDADDEEPAQATVELPAFSLVTKLSVDVELTVDIVVASVALGVHDGAQVACIADRRTAKC